ncbi:MAG: hypothetical protein IPG89_05800 [Bacteroidetes bacterium]|nr:hypothetical protein [Bacteroidota bacterium]
MDNEFHREPSGLMKAGDILDIQMKQIAKQSSFDYPVNNIEEHGGFWNTETIIDILCILQPNIFSKMNTGERIRLLQYLRTESDLIKRKKPSAKGL